MGTERRNILNAGRGASRRAWTLIGVMLIIVIVGCGALLVLR